LIEIENLYLMLLEANDLTILQEQNASAGTAEDSKEKAAARVKTLIQTIVSTILTEDRIVSTLSVRKGRRLFLQLVFHCGQEDCLKIMQAILRNLVSISKKETSPDILVVFKAMLDSKLTGLKESDWSLLWETIKSDVVESVLKYKLGNLLLLQLVLRSAIDGTALSEEAGKVVERWASILYSNVSNSNNEAYGRGLLEKSQAELLSSWLKNTSGLSIPDSVVDAIESHLAV